MYYNESIKLQYIEENQERNQNLKDVMHRLFNNSKDYEEKLNKDLSCFSLKEILEYYKYLNTTSLESLLNISSQYKLYTSWCIQRNLVFDCQNHFEECRKEILIGCLNKELTKNKIITRETLLNLIEDLPNDFEKFFTLALFEGICGKWYSDFYELRVHNFTKDEGNTYMVSLPGREITCSATLYNLAEQSADNYTFYTYKRDDNGEYKMTEKRFREDDDRIIKKGFTSTGDEMNSQIFMRRLKNIRDFLGIPSLSMTSLKESGRLYEIKKRMKEGRELTEVVGDKDLIIKYGTMPPLSRYTQKYLAE